MQLMFSFATIMLTLLGSAQTPLERYFDYLERYQEHIGPIGNADKGEIEIVRDPQKIKEIEQTTGRQVGVVAEDYYWIWMNDAVKFPNGKHGVYGRILWRKSLDGIAGIAVMPILPDGKIALNCNYRHATRSWEYELPRGGIEPNETIEEAAKREVKEETGMLIDKLYLLGHMAPDTGLTNTIVPVFLAHVQNRTEAAPEDSEAIAGIVPFTIDELKKGLLTGYLMTKIEGKECKVYLRDPFLTYALFHYLNRS